LLSISQWVEFRIKVPRGDSEAAGKKANIHQVEISRREAGTLNRHDALVTSTRINNYLHVSSNDNL
jgi:hypothetical protein